MEQADQPSTELNPNISDNSTLSSEQEKKKKPLLLIILVLAFAAVLLAGGAYVLAPSGGNNSDTSSQGKTDTTNKPSTDSALNNIEGFNLDTDIAYSPVEFMYSNLADTANIWLYGYYKNSAFGVQLTDTPDSTDYALINAAGAKGIDKIKDGDFVLVEAHYGTGTAPVADSITRISKDDVKFFNEYKYPSAKIEILDYPKTVTSGCQNIEMKVKITNTGKIDINNNDFYTTGSTGKFKFIEFVDGKIDAAYSITDDGVVQVHGYYNLGTIKPGESKTLTYGGGGYWCDNYDWCTNNGSTPNMLCAPDFSYPGGTREVKLAIGHLKPGSYTDYVIDSVSEPIKIKVNTCGCNSN